MPNGMRVMVVGEGGREHALVWKLAQSPHVGEILAVPGNPGMAGEPKTVCLMVPPDNASIAAAAKERGVDFAVIGPEAHIAAGLADAFDEAGILVLGPRTSGAILESSKVVAKDLMAHNGIPTAPYRWFDSLAAAQEYLSRHSLPVVVKADGLAAGKGATVARTKAEALAAAARWLAKDRIVVEEFLPGEEASFTCLVSGTRFVLWPTSQDHKRLLDGDQGPMTGGMGAYSPAPVMDESTVGRTIAEIVLPLLRALDIEMIPYTGFLYIGLMITAEGPQVLEFNCRLGDPEAQALLMRFRGDLAVALYQAAQGKWDGFRYDWDPRPAICVVLATHGYPENPRTRDVISGLDAASAIEGVKVFHAGTEYRDGKLVTAGGRILGVTAMGEKLSEARDRAYRAAEEIQFEGKYYRRDIGHRGIARERETKART